MTGWQLTRAKDVSADGTVIVGYGVNPAGDYEGWRAVVPEPSSITLLGIALLGFTICTLRTRRDRNPER